MKIGNRLGRFRTCASIVLLLSLGQTAWATGLATCDSGPKENWVTKQELQATLEEKGWKVRRIKEDGGCWEVYALDENGERVEAYFHPETLEPVVTEKH